MVVSRNVTPSIQMIFILNTRAYKNKKTNYGGKAMKSLGSGALCRTSTYGSPMSVCVCVGTCQCEACITSVKLSLQDDSHKQEDPSKPPQVKEEGSMNILNSHSPKHENNRPTSVAHDQGHTPNHTEENAEVNSLQNNLV